MPAHRSVSQINKYQQCPRKYRYKYIDKLEEPGNIFFAIGSAVDKALEHIVANHNFTKEHPSPPDELIQDALQVMETTRIAKIAEFNCTEEEAQEVVDTCFHLGRLIPFYFKFYLPHAGLLPMRTQVKINYGLSDLEAPITGWIDLLCLSYRTNEIVVVDFKTSGKKPSKETLSLDYKRQVWTYSKAIKEEMGLDYLPMCALHFFVKTIPKLPEQARKKVRNKDEYLLIPNNINGYEFMASEYEDVPISEYPEELLEALYSQKVVDSKIVLLTAPFEEHEWLSYNELFFDLEFSIKHNFWPKNRTHYLCCKEFCSFWNRCVGSEEGEASLQLQKKLANTEPVERAGLDDVPFSVDTPPSLNTKDTSNFLF